MTPQSEPAGRVVATLALVAALVVGGLPAAAAGGLAGVGVEPGATPGQSDAAPPGANDSSVNVTVGSQLSTVVSVTSETVRSDVEETEFDLEFEAENDSERAEALAERAETLADRAADVREDYRDATRAYERGNITREEYARRLAALNARARTLLADYDRLRNRSANVSGVELAAAGLDASAVERVLGGLDNLTGAGLSALLERFLGERDGEVSVETRGGVEVTVESEDGERTREFERPGDGSRNFTVPQAAALETARTALSDRRWVLQRASVHELEGTYRFEFGLVANDTTGEAEVRVDASSGEVVRLESEIEPVGDDESEGDADEREDDEDEFEDDDDDQREDDERGPDELALVVASGTPAPNETVTLRALAGGEPVPNATVRANDAVVGTTGADGTLTLTLPEGSVEIEVRAGDAEGELELEFEDDRDDVYDRLATDAAYSDGRVRLTVTYDGTGVAGATVSVNGDVVGTTDADGTVAFAANGSGTLAVRITKGELAASATYEVANGSVEQTDPLRSAPDDEDDELEYEELVLEVVSGTPAPGATVTVRATGDGEPVADATVRVNDVAAATTGDDGTAAVTLPDEDSVRIAVEAGGEEGELRFDFDDEETDDELEYEELDLDVVSGTPEPGATITVQALGDGDPVPNETVRVNDVAVATTDADGTATVTLPDEDSVRIAVEAGGEEGELRFDFDDEETDDG